MAWPGKEIAELLCRELGTQILAPAGTRSLTVGGPTLSCPTLLPPLWWVVTFPKPRAALLCAQALLAACHWRVGHGWFLGAATANGCAPILYSKFCWQNCPHYPYQQSQGGFVLTVDQVAIAGVTSHV